MCWASRVTGIGLLSRSTGMKSRARVTSLRHACRRSDEALRQRYELKDNRDWQLTEARKAVREDQEWRKKLIQCAYRPFDRRSVTSATVAMDYPRQELKMNVTGQENVCFSLMRQTEQLTWHHAFACELPTPAVYSGNQRRFASFHSTSTRTANCQRKTCLRTTTAAART